MAYVSWDNVAKAFRGGKRLKEALLPNIETEDAHPHLLSLILRASQYADKALRRAGYETPLSEPITDEVFKASVVGLVVGYATEGSAREAYEEDLYKIALHYFDELLTEGTLDVIGAEADDDSDSWPASFGGGPAEAAVFDVADPYAAAHSVFPALPIPRRRRW